jgi:hypothetical protein
MKILENPKKIANDIYYKHVKSQSKVNYILGYIEINNMTNYIVLKPPVNTETLSQKNGRKMNINHTRPIERNIPMLSKTHRRTSLS